MYFVSLFMDNQSTNNLDNLFLEIGEKSFENWPSSLTIFNKIATLFT